MISGSGLEHLIVTVRKSPPFSSLLSLFSCSLLVSRFSCNERKKFESKKEKQVPVPHNHTPITATKKEPCHGALSEEQHQRVIQGIINGLRRRRHHHYHVMICEGEAVEDGDVVFQEDAFSPIIPL